MTRSQKKEGWVVGKQERTPKYHGFILFTRDEGLCSVKVRSPKKLSSAPVPSLLQRVIMDVYLAGGVQPILSSYHAHGGVDWNTLTGEQLSLAYIFLESITALLPKELPQEVLYDAFEEVMSLLRTTQDVLKLKVVGLYHFLVLLGLFSCGDTCGVCHKPFPMEGRYGFSEESLEICCPMCATPQMRALDPMSVKWMRLIEKRDLSFVMNIHGEEKILKEIDGVVTTIIVYTLGRPLHSMAYL